MNDLNDLRRALHAPDPELRPLDIGTIMRTGARVRRRRRLTVGAGSGLAVLVLLIGGGQLARVVQQPAQHAPGGQLTASSPLPASSPVSASSTVAPSATVTPRASDRASPWPGAARADYRVLGKLVPTGVRAGTGGWVLHMTKLEIAELPQTRIGIMASRLLPSGELVQTYAANETQGSDRSPGFHAVSLSQVVGGVTMPAFGYYAGPAAKITGTSDGRVVGARQARWSEDPSVTIFWFDPASVRPGTELTRLTAYDRNGKTLPAGDATPGVG